MSKKSDKKAIYITGIVLLLVLSCFFLFMRGKDDKKDKALEDQNGYSQMEITNDDNNSDEKEYQSFDEGLQVEEGDDYDTGDYNVFFGDKDDVSDNSNVENTNNNMRDDTEEQQSEQVDNGVLDKEEELGNQRWSPMY